MFIKKDKKLKVLDEQTIGWTDEQMDGQTTMRKDKLTEIIAVQQPEYNTNIVVNSQV